MISFEIALVLGLILFLLVALYREWFRPAISFFIVITILAFFGVLSPKEALSGLANEQLVVIILLLIISNVISKTTIVEGAFDRLFKNAKTYKGFMARMVLFVSSTSAFFNNTPLVAMTMPYVYRWSKNHKTSSSKLLIPLSYAAILGGGVTLIGTSTNLIVNGMAIDAGFESLNLFDFTPVGLVMLIVGGGYLYFLSFRLLPNRKDLIEDFIESSREYFIETEIPSNSELLGKTVTDAGLRNLKDVFLIEIIRRASIIKPVSPNEILEAGDKLLFTGATNSLADFTNTVKGLSLPKASVIPENEKSDIVEIVISYNSALIGVTIKESDFRGKYDGAIIAVHRNGEKISGKIGDVELQAGDVLLVMGGKDFYKRISGNQAFYILSTTKSNQRDVNSWKIYSIITALVFSIIVASLHILPFFTCLIGVIGLALLLNVMPANDIRKGIDFNLVSLLAMGLALGKAMINSGAADFISTLVMEHMGSNFGAVGMLVGIFVITNLLSAYVTNKAAVAIVFPVAVSIAANLGVDAKPFILMVALSAASSFITPIGFQTNLMVYGPGGYTFKDFMKIGLPLTLIYLVVSVVVLAYTYQLI